MLVYLPEWKIAEEKKGGVIGQKEIFCWHSVWDSNPFLRLEGPTTQPICLTEHIRQLQRTSCFSAAKIFALPLRVSCACQHANLLASWLQHRSVDIAISDIAIQLTRTWFLARCAGIEPTFTY